MLKRAMKPASKAMTANLMSRSTTVTSKGLGMCTPKFMVIVARELMKIVPYQRPDQVKLRHQAIGPLGDLVID